MSKVHPVVSTQATLSQGRPNDKLQTHVMMITEQEIVNSDKRGSPSDEAVSPPAKGLTPVADTSFSTAGGETDQVETTPQPVTPETPKPVSAEQVEEGEVMNQSTAAGSISVSYAQTNNQPELEKTDSSSDQSPTENQQATEQDRRRRSSLTASSRTRDSKKRSSRNDDASSSDDDSSYFASNLPSPKSGRSFSYSSAGGSAHAVRSSFFQNSDDLSFSDESDEDAASHPQSNGRSSSPVVQPRRASMSDMNRYPQPITRMHSASSLMSSESDEHSTPRSRTMSASTMSSHSTGNDDAESPDLSVHGELPDLAEYCPGSSPFPDQNGRLPPLMGQHPDPLYQFASPQPRQSPPSIVQGFFNQHSPSTLHPQPQALSQDQISSWVTGDYGTHKTQHEPAMAPSLGSGDFRSLGEAAIPLSYSTEDEEMIVTMAGGQRRRQPPPGVPSSSDKGAQYANFADNPYPPQQQQQTGDVRNSAVPTPYGPSSSVKGSSGGGNEHLHAAQTGDGFKVYRQRWLMLLYMSMLNLLSDWTCYSVAPIALLTEKAFGDVDPERLVVVFLGANAIATAAEPIILSRLGLRRTVLFGALMLMIGSVVKSGGIPPILPSDMQMGHDEWRLYLGFFLVGLSQPLYQCTPALLSASWFPEKERTMATGVALNANQLGIGCAFVFGTLLVSQPEDIIPYFGLLSTISTVVFLGTLIQFEDAPPTPPSSSARVMRGTLNIPGINSIVQSVRDFGSTDTATTAVEPSVDEPGGSKSTQRAKKSTGSSTRRRTSGRSQTTVSDSNLLPSAARSGRTSNVVNELSAMREEAATFLAPAPSPALPGPVGQNEQGDQQETEGDQNPDEVEPQAPYPVYDETQAFAPGDPTAMPQYGYPANPYQFPPYWDPRMQQHLQQQQAYYQQQMQYYYQQAPPQMSTTPYYYPTAPYPPYPLPYEIQPPDFPPGHPFDEGVEPIITITPNHLDIDIKDDQVMRSLRACFARPGFIHALVSFAVSGIVINTLSTYMDYLVRLNGAPRYYTGVVGGTFQFVIMISSLIVGKQTDRTRAYYTVTIGMLVLGAFGLAECGVSLDADRGGDLRWSLVVVAALVGPLQPVSTELGVDVVYPLSENTVLVIQQLFSNLLSALFIPIFKALKDVGSSTSDDDLDAFERPEYTFSFYLLIVLHTLATIFFATFNGKYLRYEHELQKKEQEERRASEGNPSYQPQHTDIHVTERQPLLQSAV